jgi:carbamoyl-phosphate synthase large subunit
MLKLFIRQPFTQSGDSDKLLVQGVLDLIVSMDGDPVKLKLLTGTEAESDATFRQSFEKKTGLPFTPKHFRRHRLAMLQQADAMIIIRTGLSESGAFEVGYNVFSGNRRPMLFAISRDAPIKTTLLRELDDLCVARYHQFDQPSDLREALKDFFKLVVNDRNGAPRRIAQPALQLG